MFGIISMPSLAPITRADFLIVLLELGASWDPPNHETYLPNRTTNPPFSARPPGPWIKIASRPHACPSQQLRPPPPPPSQIQFRIDVC